MLHEKSMPDKKLSALDGNVNTSRVAYLDNLKSLMIIFVVITHTAITYSGNGGWFYMEHKNIGNISFYIFIFYELFAQAFYMAFLFMLSGSFIPASLAKKGTKKFIKDRLYRLGIPLIIFVFLLDAICVKMARPNLQLLDWYFKGIISFKFFSWTGPLWFVLILLIFTLIYVALKKYCDKLVSKYSFDVSIKNIWILILLITIVAFAIRQIFPIGSSFINLQFSFFSAYIFMFLIGIIAYQQNIFEKIDYKKAKNYLILAFGLGVPLWSFIIYFGSSRAVNAKILLEGGWNIWSFAYAFWESFFCVTISIALLGIFRAKFNTQNSLQKFMSANAFGVYVFHPLVLIAISVFLLKNIDLPPMLKFVVCACIAVPASFVFASLIRKIPFLGKIFS